MVILVEISSYSCSKSKCCPAGFRRLQTSTDVYGRLQTTSDVFRRLSSFRKVSLLSRPSKRASIILTCLRSC